MNDGIFAWKRGCLGSSEPKKGVHGFQHSKYEIAEFLTETERKKCKNTQKTLLDGCYVLFEEYLQEKHLARVVQTLNSAIHRINHYPAD